MQINCKNKFSKDFVYLVEQLLPFLEDISLINNSDIRRIIRFANEGFWYSVTKETLTILYNEFSSLSIVNIGSDLNFIKNI